MDEESAKKWFEQTIAEGIREVEIRYAKPLDDVPYHYHISRIDDVVYVDKELWEELKELFKEKEDSYE